MKIITKFWIGLIILIVLSPLGLILPKYFKAGCGWGEWNKGGLWNAPMPDYAFQGWQEKGLPQLSFAYVVSAVTGVLIVIMLMWFIAKILIKK